MELGLDGCVAIVTGASSGMGRACAVALGREGCSVALFARRRGLLEEAAAEVEGLGSGAHALAVPGDSADPASLQALVDGTLERFGRIDIVVNNTGGPPAGGFEDFDDDAWRTAWELTLMSALRLTRLALPELRRSGRGRVVNITSSAVKEPNEGLLLSNTYRPGVTGWAKTLSQDEGPNGITVNSIAPGYIDTERMQRLYAAGTDPDEDRRRDEALIPARRFGGPEEIGDVCAFLCSTRAAYINGITVLVDGGLARGLLS
ncbi:MAG TPA: SDR family oxidoreductase [Gaiellales bacterium]|nr:SDR family oxidoreductase [Gaiellales bacterium]